MRGRDIRRIRGALGLTQLEFAGLLNVHPGTVSRWENEAAFPDEWQRSVLDTLAQAARKAEAATVDRAQTLLTAGAIGLALGLLLSAVLEDD